MVDNYFYIDGSSLQAQIRKLKKSKPSFEKRKLDPLKFIQYFSRALSSDLGSDEYKRGVFYFPKGSEKEVEEYFSIPNFQKSGLVRDIHFKYCGKKIKGSEAFNKLISEKIPPKWHDRCAKSEKGVDIEICCDALKLAANNKLERLFLFTNDQDFIPLCRTLKDFGSNISLIHLSEDTKVSKDLVEECDTYDYVPKDQLESIFTKDPVETPEKNKLKTKKTPAKKKVAKKKVAKKKK